MILHHGDEVTEGKYPEGEVDRHCVIFAHAFQELSYIQRNQNLSSRAAPVRNVLMFHECSQMFHLIIKHLTEYPVYSKAIRHTV